MIISPNRRFVFVHVHKCAGTSIETALASTLTVNDFVIGSTADGERNKAFLNELIALKKHSSAAEALKVIGEARWKTLFTFGFVREPVDRLRSLYAYARGLAERSPLTPEEAKALAESDTLPQRTPYKFKAVQSAVASPDFDAFVRNPRTWQDAGAKAQWTSLCNEEGELLVNFVGKVEHIDRDWEKVQKRLQITAELGVQNKSPNLKVDELSPAAWVLIRKHYLRDYRMFKYPVPAGVAALAPPKAAKAAKAAA